MYSDTQEKTFPFVSKSKNIHNILYNKLKNMSIINLIYITGISKKVLQINSTN